MAEEALRLVQPGVLWRFFQTPLAERMRRADEEGRLYKEQQFVVGIPAREMDEADSDELVLIQGIIDAWFEDEDGAVLVDYKTDRIGEGGGGGASGPLPAAAHLLQTGPGADHRKNGPAGVSLFPGVTERDPGILKIPGPQDAGRAIPPPRRSAPLHREGIRSSGRRSATPPACGLFWRNRC